MEPREATLIALIVLVLGLPFPLALVWKNAKLYTEKLTPFRNAVMFGLFTHAMLLLALAYIALSN